MITALAIICYLLIGIIWQDIFVNHTLDDKRWADTGREVTIPNRITLGVAWFFMVVIILATIVFCGFLGFYDAVREAFEDIFHK